MLNLRWNKKEHAHDVYDGDRYVALGTGEWFANEVREGRLRLEDELPSSGNYNFTTHVWDADRQLVVKNLLGGPLPDLNPDGSFCRPCGSYVHRYLPKCPSCGLGRVSEFPRAVEEWAKAESGDIAAVARREYNARLIRLSGKDKPNRYRYLGDLPGHPPCDATIEYGGDKNIVLVGSTGPLAFVNPAYVLTMMAFERKVAYSNWFIVSMGQVAVAQQPLADGGAMTVVFSSGGELRQFSVGNKSGMLTPKYPFIAYVAEIGLIGLYAEAFPLAREAEIGPVAYARELGLSRLADEYDVAATSQQAAPADVAQSLRSLASLRDDGLISAEEFASKRAEILKRL